MGRPPYLEPVGTATARARNDKKEVLSTADEGVQYQHCFKVKSACRWGRKKGHGEKGGRGFSPRSRLSDISANGNKERGLLLAAAGGGGFFLFTHNVYYARTAHNVANIMII